MLITPSQLQSSLKWSAIYRKGTGAREIRRLKNLENHARAQKETRYGPATVIDIDTSTGQQSIMPAICDRRSNSFVPYNCSSPKGVLLPEADTRLKPAIIIPGQNDINTQPKQIVLPDSDVPAKPLPQPGQVKLIQLDSPEAVDDPTIDTDLKRIFEKTVLRYK